MKLRKLPIVFAGCLLAAGASRAQFVEDSIDVGGAWVGSLVYNSAADVVYGASEDGRFFTIDCAANHLNSWIGLPCPYDITYDSSDSKAYCTFGDQGAESLLVVDGHSHVRLKALPLPNASRPLWSPDNNRLFVTLSEEGSVAVIDCATDSLIARIRVGAFPLLMHLNRPHRKLYVHNCDGGSVSVIDIDANRVTRTIQIGEIYCAAGWYSERADKYYASVLGSVAIIDGVADTLLGFAPLPQGAYARSVAGCDGSDSIFIGVTNGNCGFLYVLDAREDTVVSVLSAGRAPAALVWSRWTDLVYSANMGSASVSVVDLRGGGAIRTLGVGDYPAVMVQAHEHGRIYVGHHNTSFVYVLRDSSLGVRDDGVAARRQNAALRPTPALFTSAVTLVLDAEGPERLLEVFSPGGALLKRLTSRAALGRLREWVWDGTDDTGKEVPAGVYLAVVGRVGAAWARVVKVKGISGTQYLIP